MKKNIFIAAVAALTLTMTACQKETIAPAANNEGGDVYNEARVKSTADLHGTSWTYTVTYTELLNNLLGSDYPCVDSISDETYQFGLMFDGTYAHFSFPESIMVFGGDEGVLDQISGVSYTYSYDGTSHTGYLDGVAENGVGDTVPAHLQFVYNDSTDVITFDLNLFYPEDNTPVVLTLNFARNE